MDWFWIWFAKPLAELAFGLTAVLVVAVAIVLWSIPTWIKQAHCKHEDVFETGACDAVCRKCGKNLGFIGAWRKARQESI